MRLQKEVFEAYKDHIGTHMEENRRGAMAMKNDLEHSPLYWNGTVDKTVPFRRYMTKRQLPTSGRSGISLTGSSAR